MCYYYPEVIFMKHKNQIVKYILSAVIILSLLILVVTSYKQIGRMQATKRLESLQELRSDSMNQDPEENRIYSTTVNPEESKIYSTAPNPQKKWIEMNSDYQGWIRVDDTIIDFPVVKAKDNAYYLDRDFFKDYSAAGSIFMDYRNTGSFKDRHTVIYGHYQSSGLMFADLHKFKDYEFASEHTISFDSLYKEKEFTVFSVYIDSADNAQLKLRFDDDESYENYLKEITEGSMYEFDVDVNADKLLLTLASCSFEIDNGRIIIHAIEK